MIRSISCSFNQLFIFLLKIDHVSIQVINYTAEDIARLSNIFAQYLAKLANNLNTRLRSDSDNIINAAIVISDLKELKHYVDLDRMSMDVLGITNPIGQLSSWLAHQLSWIVQAIQNVFKSIIQGFVSGIESFINMVKNAIMGAIQGIANGINSLVQQFNSFISSIGNMIRAGFSQLASFLSNIPKMISSALANVAQFLSQIPSMIESAFSRVASFIQSAISQVISVIQNIPSMISNFFSQVGSMIQNAFSQVVSFLERIPSMIAQAFTQIENAFAQFGNMIRNAFGQFISIVERLPQMIMSALTRFGQWIAQLPRMIMNAFQTFGHMIQNAFSELYNFLTRELPTIVSRAVATFVHDVYNWIMSAVRQIQTGLNVIREFFANVWKHIVNGLTMIAHAFTGFVNAIMHFPQWFPKWFYDHIAKPIVDGFKQLAKWLWDMLPNWMKNAIKTIEGFFHGVYDFFTKTLPHFILHDIPDFFLHKFPELVTGLPKWFYEHIAKPIVQGLESLGKWIWEHLPPWIKSAIIQIEKFFHDVYDFFTKTLPNFFLHTLPDFFLHKVPEFITGLPKWFEKHIAEPIVKGLTELGKWIWDHLPSWLKNAINAIENFFKDAYNFFTKTLPSFFNKVEHALVELFTNPFKFINDYIIKPVWHDLQAFAGMIINGLKTIGEWLYHAIYDVASAFWSLITGFAKEVESIVLPFLTNAKQGFLSLFKLASDRMKSLIMELSKGKVQGRGEIEVIGLVLADMISETLPIMVVPYVIKGLSNLVYRITLSMNPFGLGARIGLRLGKFFAHLADSFKEVWVDTVKGVFVGYGFSVAEVFRRAIDYYINMMFRNYIPIELPTVHECLEMLRRVSVTQHFKDDLDYLVKFLEMRGYSDRVIELLLDPQMKYVFNICDRFGNKLMLDVALFFRLPTHTEICSFMMRDLFASFVDFTKLMMAHGYPQSAAYMVWLLHFKYPSLKDVWEFTCRAVAGECWISKDSFIYKSILSDYQKLMNDLRQAGLNVNLFEPVDTMSLNMVNGSVPQVVLEAIPKYARWLAKAPFSWINGYTSDALMIIDIVAKIPTKIDLRWMCRYGIFQAWSAWGITFSDNLDAIHQKLIAGHAAQNPQPVYQNILQQLQSSQVVFDLRQFCRMLMAEGTHPLWIPWIAIAEAQIAFQSAKTLLRTGFLDLFRYGLADLSTLNKLLSGFFNITYLVSYFDIKQNKWFDAQVTIPVFYIPPEAKLYEIRAIMDRAYHIFNDLLHRLEHTVRLALIKPDEAISELKYFVSGQGQSVFKLQLQNNLNKWYSTLMKQITGQEATISIDPDYLNFIQYIMYIDYWTYIYERVRYWYLRILSASIYRIMYGYIEPSDIEKIVQLAVKYGHITQYEAEALQNLLNLIAGIVKREYIPTPYELATLAEYIPQVIKLAPEVFKKRGVPPEWQKIWLELIEIKPLRPYVHKLAEILERATRYGLYTIEQLNREYSKLTQYGYTQKEIQLMLDYAIQDKGLYYFEHVIPTLLGLTDYYEYVPEFLDVLKKKLETVLADKDLFNKIGIVDARKLFNMYIQLAINRSVRWVVKECITELVYLYGKGYIDDRTFDQYLSKLAKYGLNQYQIELIKLRAQLRRMRYLRRE